MIEEAIDNREQKAKQRAKEYERKREAKWRNRQMYHMRHTRDYDALGVPIGASKADVKAAYKKLAGEGLAELEDGFACRGKQAMLPRKPVALASQQHGWLN